MGKQWKQWHTLFWRAPKSRQMVTAAMKWKNAIPWKESYDQPRQHIKKQMTLSTSVHLVKAMVFSSGHVWMWELDYKESWALKNCFFWTVVLEKTLESPLDARRSSQSILKEISPEYSLEGLMLKLKLQYFGHLMQKLTHLKRPWCWERLKAGEGNNRGWDGWMALSTQWMWISANSGK